MTVQIWRNRSEGEKYVVETDDNGIVLAAAGPLHHSEVPQARKDGVVNPDVELADWLNQNENDFALDESVEA